MFLKIQNYVITHSKKKNLPLITLNKLHKYNMLLKAKCMTNIPILRAMFYVTI